MSSRFVRPQGQDRGDGPVYLPRRYRRLGERAVASVDGNAVTNPTVLVEVTSNSSEDYDRGEKLNHYKQCPSVLAVLIVSHRRAQVTAMSRGTQGWDQREYRSGEHVQLHRPDLSLDVDALYATRLERTHGD